MIAPATRGVLIALHAVLGVAAIGASIPVGAVTPSRKAELAPHRWAHPHSRWRARRAGRPVDELLLCSPTGDGESLVVVRLVVGSAMLASIVLAVVAIRRRDFTSHGAWMTRAYAIALGAGTRYSPGCRGRSSSARSALATSCRAGCS